MARTQAKIGRAARDGKNTTFDSSYASLTAVLDVVQAPLSENELAVVQAAAAEGVRVEVTTLLLHVSGEWISSRLEMTARDVGPQAIGSAISYCRRYALTSLLNVAAADDDGERAEGRAGTTRVATPSDGALRIVQVDRQDGATAAGRAWQRWTLKLSDGRAAATFDTKLGALAAQLCQEHAPVEVEITPGKKGGFDVTRLVPAAAPNSVPF